MIFLNVDLAQLLDLKEIDQKTRTALREAARDLSLQTHAHIAEEVNANLHSTREKYLAGMDFNQVSDDTWVISLDRSAMWIEEGMPEHEMLDDLLGSKKAKTAKDGSKYITVPFEHNKGPTKQTQAQTDLTNTIKAELKRRQIPYGKLENGTDGKPKTGLLHSFDIMKQPIKTHEGPGQGKGLVGAVRQGPTGIPFLQGIRVYQKQIKDAATGKSKIVKSIMTFRTASSKMKGSGRWVHPGLEAKQFFDKAAQWALDEFERKIGPQVLAKINRSL